MKSFYQVLLLATITHPCLSQENSAISKPVSIKIINENYSATSQPVHLKISEGPVSSSLSESIHVVVGYQVSRVAGVSASIPIRVGQLNKVPLQEFSRGENQITNSIVARELPVITNLPSFRALIIAVENYQASAGLIGLSQPVKDAGKLYLTLTSKYNFPKENATLLKNPTRAEILQAFEDLSKKITPKENVIIFFAGHGIWDERLKVGYWLPSDAKIGDKANWIANSTVRDYIAGIQSKHTLLITDACFSGSIFKSREAGMNDYAMAKVYQLPSRKAMTSGTLTTVPDDSKFMEYLLKRLNENEDAYLTAKQLFFSFETAVLNNTHAVPQYGTIQDTGDEGGDFVFIKN
jgi:Caspase domain